jgi:hypothetical protein
MGTEKPNSPVGQRARNSVDIAESEKARVEARRFIDSLAERFYELDKLSLQAKRLNHISDNEYASFRNLFESFSMLSGEFQGLSHLTEGRLLKIEHNDASKEKEHQELSEQFSRLQVPMLCAVINTNMRLLKAWDDRLQFGESLPLGAFELFLQTLRIISDARIELKRPCYAEWLDEEALREADRVERLLDVLMERAPKLREFLVGHR